MSVRGVSPQGEVSAQEVSGQGGVCPEGVSVQGECLPSGVSAWGCPPTGHPICPGWCLSRGCLSRGVCLGGVCPGGVCQTPLPRGQNDRQVKKHYLAATMLRTVNIIPGFGGFVLQSSVLTSPEKSRCFQLLLISSALGISS